MDNHSKELPNFNGLTNKFVNQIWFISNLKLRYFLHTFVSLKNCPPSIDFVVLPRSESKMNLYLNWNCYSIDWRNTNLKFNFSVRSFNDKNILIKDYVNIFFRKLNIFLTNEKIHLSIIWLFSILFLFRLCVLYF